MLFAKLNHELNKIAFENNSTKNSLGQNNQRESIKEKVLEYVQ